MTTTNTTRYLSPTESARLLKKDLRAAFPGIKFSCRGSRGTGYGNLSVSWTDGPTSDEVDAVVSRYEGKGFDGMDDSTYYMKKTLVVEGEKVLSGLGIIGTSRDISAGAMVRARAELLDAGFVIYHEWDMESAARSLASGSLDAQSLVCRNGAKR